MEKIISQVILILKHILYEDFQLFLLNYQIKIFAFQLKYFP